MKVLGPGALLAASVMVLAVLVALPTSPAATSRTLVINNASADPQVDFSGFDANPPKVFDFNGDGELEILAQNDNQYVYVFDSTNGQILFEAKTRFPAGWGARSFNGPEASVMTEDGKTHLIVANSAAIVTSYLFDAAGSTGTNFRFVKEWDRRLDDCFGKDRPDGPGMDSKPVFGDLDRDGRFEIVVATEENGVYALRHNGDLYWKKCIGGGNGEPAVGDLNNDGWLDVVFGSDGGILTAMNGRTGATMWTYNVRANFNIGPGSMPVAPTIAQLDGLGGPDVIFGARDGHDGTDYSNDHALLGAVSSGGALLWARQDPTGNPLTYTRPVVVDAAGDGTPEVYWADWNTIGHFPGNWEVTGPGHFYRYDHQGNLVWRHTLGTYWSNKDVPLADIDGDGTQEMLANGPNASGHDGIWYLNSEDGQPNAGESFVDVWPFKVARAPVLADFWGTGTMQFVLEVGQDDASSGGTGILVYDTGKPYNSAWPHVPYPTLEPSAGFLATFSNVAGNQYWQEVLVQANEPLAGVDVRVNCGATWSAMTHHPEWGGKWTASVNAPSGSKVDFRARSSQGGQILSGGYIWPAATPTSACGAPPTTTTPPPTTTTTPPPTTTTTPPTTTTTPPTTTTTPPGDMTAMFRNVAGNTYWQEVIVDANEALAGVDVRVNCGTTWNPMTHHPEWGGKWTAGRYAPQGSKVDFRARSTDGDQVISGAYTWTGATPTTACGTPPPPSDFTASFSGVAGNAYWEEVLVSASESLAGVDVRVNCAATWSTMTFHPEWGGKWTAGLHAPQGATVDFRARSTDGDQVISGAYTWTSATPTTACP